MSPTSSSPPAAMARGERGIGDYDRSQTPYGRDEYRRTSFAGIARATSATSTRIIAAGATGT